MKRLIFITTLLLLAFVAKSQTPFIGDRLFISADKQDSMWIRFIGDTIFFKGDNGFFKFGKAIMVDSIRLKDGKWHKSIVTVENDPVYNAEKSSIVLKADSSLIYATKYVVGQSIKDSLAGFKLLPPKISIKPTRDSTVYEMTTWNKYISVPVNYTITRPRGCPPITYIGIDNKSLAVPVINEGATYSGRDTIKFNGGTGFIYSKTFKFKVATAKDTTVDSLKLYQSWNVMVGGEDIFSNNGWVLFGYNYWDYAHQLYNNGAIIYNYQVNNKYLIILLPYDIQNKRIYINGLPASFLRFAPLERANIDNKNGANYKYTAWVSTYKIKGTIQTIEIK